MGLIFGSFFILGLSAVIIALISVIIFLLTDKLLNLGIKFEEIFISFSLSGLSAIVLLLFLTYDGNFKNHQTYLEKTVDHIEALNNVETQLVKQISNYKLLATEERYKGNLTGQEGYGAYSHLLYSYFHHLNQNHKALADESTLLLGNAILAQDLLTEAEKAQEAGSFIDFAVAIKKLDGVTAKINQNTESIYNHFSLIEHPIKDEMFSPKFYTALKQKELIKTERMLFEEMEADLQAQLKAYPEQKIEVTPFELYSWHHYMLNLIVFLVAVALLYWHRRVE